MSATAAATPRTLRLNVRDNVRVAIDTILPGSIVEGVTASQRVPKGHKIAVTGIAAHSVRPLRLALVKAAPGDTPDILAARMAIANGRVERFRILNGLDPSTALTPGESYKVVAE